MSTPPRDFREWMKQVDRKLAQAIRSGNSGVITEVRAQIRDIEKQVEEAGGDTRTPSHPIELEIQTALYTTRNSRTLGRATIEFPPVVYATDGTAVEIDYYELWGRDESAWNGEEESAPAWTMLDTSSVVPSVMADQLEPGSTWRFRVRAIGTTTVHPGEWSSELVADIGTDTIPPSIPSVPVLTQKFGVVTAYWDGLAGNGEPMEPDFDYLELAYGGASGVNTPSGYVLDREGALYVTGLEYNTPYYFRFRTVDFSGNASAWTQSIPISVTPLVDEQSIKEKIAETEQHINDSIAEVNQAGAQLAQRMEDAETELDTAGDAITNLRDVVLPDVRTKLDEASLWIADTGAELGTRLNTAEGTLTDAQDRLDEAEEEISTVLPSKIADAKQQALNEAASTAQSKVDAAKTVLNTQISQIIASGNNLVRNGDFEAGNDGWSIASTYTIVSSPSRSGSKAMQVAPATGNGWPASDQIATAPGRIYYFEFWARRTGNQSVPAGVGFVYQTQGASGAYSTPVKTLLNGNEISDTEWTKVSGTVTVTYGDAVKVKFAPWFKQSTNTYYLDDVLVVDITEAQASLDAAQKAQTDATSALTKAGAAQTTADAALSSANGKTKIYRSTSVPSGTGSTSGDVWWQYADSTYKVVIGEWVWAGSPGAWNIQKAGHQTIASLDVGSLVVVGTSKLSNVVAERIAADSGQFIELDVEQLTATGTSTLNEIVSKNLWAEIARFNKVTADQMAIGSGENILPWLVNASPKDSSDYNGYSSGGVNPTIAGDSVGVGGGNHLIMNADWVAPNSDTLTWSIHPENSIGYPVIPGESYRFRGYVKAGGVYSGAMPTVRVDLYFYNEDRSIISSTYGEYQGLTWGWETLEATGTVPAGTKYVTPYIRQNQPGNIRLDLPSLVRMVDSSLVVDGGIAARSLKLDGDMQASLGTFLEIDVDQLTATGTSTLNEVVSKNLWSELARFNKVTADMAVLGRGSNLIVDPYLQDPTICEFRRTHADLYGTYSTQPTTSLRIFGDEANTQATTRSKNYYFSSVPSKDDTSGMIPVEPGQVFRYRFTVSSYGGGYRPTAYIVRRDGSSSYTSGYFGGGSGMRPAGIRVEYDDTWTPPDDVAYWIPAVQFDTPTTGGYVYGGASVTNMANASLIVDGGVEARNIKASEEMSAKLGEFLVVRAGMIESNAFEGDTFTGGTFTGTVWQSDAAANKGVKLYSSGIWGYGTDGSSRFTLSANTGLLSMYGGTISAAVIQTTSTANRGVKMTDYGLVAYSGSGTKTFELNGSSGDLSIYGATLTAGTVQTTSVANRGIKMTSSGLFGYDSAGNSTFSLNASNGFLSIAGRYISGPDASTPRWVIVPWEEDSSNNRIGIWMVKGGSSGIGGSETAGIYIEDPISSGTRRMQIRGLNGSGVLLRGDSEVTGELYASSLAVPGTRIQQANGSFFTGSVNFKDRLLNSGAPTTTLLENAHISVGGSSAGTFYRSSSASRYKVDPQQIEPDDSLLDIPVMDWIDKAEYDQRQELVALGVRTKDQQMDLDYITESGAVDSSVPLKRVPGVIAETVAEAEGGDAYVLYNQDGEAEGVAYSRLALARTHVLKRKLAASQQEVAELRDENMEIKATLTRVLEHLGMEQS